MTTHEHKWRYITKPSKSTRNVVVERICGCGISQWYSINEKEWSRERFMSPSEYIEKKP